MTRRIVELTDFNGVAAGQKATLKIDVGPIAVHAIFINYTTATAGGANQTNMEAELTRIRCNIDGVTQREFTAAELFAINAYRGIAFRTGSLPVFFSELWRRTMQGEDSLAWRLGDVRTFQIEIEIDAGATSPTLEGRMIYEDIPANQSAMGPIVKWKRFNIPVSATGVRNESGLPKQDHYYSIHCFSPDIDNVRLETDRHVWWDLSEAQMTDVITDYGFSPQASMYHIDFAHTGRVADLLPMVNGGRQVGTFKIDFDMGAATGFDIVTEVLGPRD
jgi:hypothetical protein